jgi:hypothetical protein
MFWYLLTRAGLLDEDEKDLKHTGPIMGKPSGFPLGLRRNFVVHLET